MVSASDYETVPVLSQETLVEALSDPLIVLPTVAAVIFVVLLM